MASGSTAIQSRDSSSSGQASAEDFQQCAEFLLLRNRGFGPLAVPVLAIALARRAAATVCAAVQSTAPLFRRWRPAGFPALGPRSALTSARLGSGGTQRLCLLPGDIRSEYAHCEPYRF